jgi:hypothetical protein
VQGQDTVVDGQTMIIPPDITVATIDAFVVRGLQYEVDGKPQVYPNPFTGAVVQAVNITRVDG